MNRIPHFLRLLRELQKIDPEFPLQYAIALGEISLNEGLSISSLSEKMNLSMSTISRIVGALSNTRQKGDPYGLVRVLVSERERRRKEVYLTAKGRDLIASIDALLENKKYTNPATARIASAV